MTPDIREADGLPDPVRARALIQSSLQWSLRNRVVEGDAGTQWDSLLGNGPDPRPRCACGNLMTIIERGPSCRQCELARRRGA